MSNRFATKTDDEIDVWIKNHEEKHQTHTDLYHALLEERSRRRSKLLNIEESLQHLMASARRCAFTTYGDLAGASGVAWEKARHAMNGAGGHLDALLDVCHARGLPLLTAICVNQKGVLDGTLEPSALEGFAKGAQRLGYPVTDSLAFLRGCQTDCFKWGQDSRAAAPD